MMHMKRDYRHRLMVSGRPGDSNRVEASIQIHIELL